VPERNVSVESRAGIGLSDSGLHLVGEEEVKPEPDKPVRTTSIAMVVPASALFSGH
jgi:hypothetical protein